VLETMTPLDFLDFRDFLFPASGFQSGQFRLIEIRLGLARGMRSQYAGKSFDDTLTEADRSRIATAERGPRLIDQLDRWLSRTPFVHRPDYDFSLEYRKAVKQMLEDDAARVRANAAMGPQQREAEAKRIEASLEEFQAIFAPASGPSPWQMSRAAVQAALFIIVYRDRPVLQLPFRLLAALMNVDELLTLWRYRHALMVQRMIGVKIGTGGSAGHDYLRDTAAKHRIFSDLFRLSTYLIPRRTAIIFGRTRRARPIAARSPTPRGSPTTNGTRSSVTSSHAHSAASPPFSPCPIPRPSRSHPTPTTSSAGSSPRCRRARRSAFSQATANFIPSRARSPASRKTGSSPSSASPPNRS